jgi:solute carrier family 44 protein 1 (choline transporter-like protein)
VYISVCFQGYIGYYGYTVGDPYRVLYGVDTWGNTCNKKNIAIENATYSGKDTTGLK